MNNCTVTPLFSIPIYSSEVFLQNELSILKTLEFADKDDYGTAITNNNNILSLPEFSEIKRQIDGHVEAYVRAVLCINKLQSFHMVRSWGVIVGNGAKAQVHRHGNSIISGVFYLSATNDSGALKLHRGGDSLFPATLEFDFDEYNEFNSDRWSFTPSPGLLYLFPSHIKHEVEQNNSNERRYSIAFDYWTRGAFGSSNDINKLYLK
jgi:uncharacterized protein (TIGR02466 family)